MKRDEERGPFGAWLVRQRKAKPGRGRDGKMTADEARHALQLATGYGISASVWAELEAGTRRPSGEQRQRLEDWAGERSPRGEVTDLAEVAAALERIADALRDSFRLRDEVIGLRVEIARLAVDLETIRGQEGGNGSLTRRDKQHRAKG